MKRLLKFTMAICIVFAVGGMLSVTAQAKKNVTVSPAVGLPSRFHKIFTN